MYMPGLDPDMLPRVAVAVYAGQEVLGSLWVAVKGPLSDERMQALTEAAGLAVAGVLTDGRTFQDIREFKRLLLDHEEQTVARNLISQLVTYSTGAPVGFSDRKLVQEILDRTRGSGHGVRDIVDGIVASDLFRNK